LINLNLNIIGTLRRFHGVRLELITLLSQLVFSLTRIKLLLTWRFISFILISIIILTIITWYSITGFVRSMFPTPPLSETMLDCLLLFDMNCVFCLFVY